MIDDIEFLEQAWALVTHPVDADAVLALLSDGLGGVCPRALLMFELAAEIAAMHDGTLTTLHAAWTRSQFLTPAPIRQCVPRRICAA